MPLISNRIEPGKYRLSYQGCTATVVEVKKPYQWAFETEPCPTQKDGHKNFRSIKEAFVAWIDSGDFRSEGAPAKPATPTQRDTWEGEDPPRAASKRYSIIIPLEFLDDQDPFFQKHLTDIREDFERLGRLPHWCMRHQGLASSVRIVEDTTIVIKED